MVSRLPLCSAPDCPAPHSSSTPCSATFSASSLPPRSALPPSFPSLTALPHSSLASKPSSNPLPWSSPPPPEQGTPYFCLLPNGATCVFFSDFCLCVNADLSCYANV